MGTAANRERTRTVARLLIVVMAVLLVILLSAVVGTWVARDSDDDGVDDWSLLDADMGAGDPSVVVARSSADGWEIDVTHAGDVPVSAECPEPRLATVVPDVEAATVAVLIQWPSRGCETGPKVFTVRLATLDVPFRVIVVGEPCRAAEVTSDGSFALQLTDERDCG